MKYSTIQIKHELHEYYTFNHLQSIYHKILKPLVKDNKKILLTNGVRSEGNVNKNFLLDLFTIFLTDPSLRAHLFNSLSSDTKIILEKVVWLGDLRDVEVDQLINQEMISEQDDYYGHESQQWIKDEFKLFCFDIQSSGYYSDKASTYSVYLPAKIASLFKEKFKAPAGAKLITYQSALKAGATEHSFLFQQGEKSPNELQLAHLYLQQGLLTYTKQNKPAKVSLKKMQKALQCSEYYTETATADTNSIHVNLLALISEKLEFYARFQNHEKNNKIDLSSLSSMELLQLCYTMLSNGKSFSLLVELLTHLKNRNHIQFYTGYNDKSLHKNLFSEIKKIPALTWVNIDQWGLYLRLNDIDINVISLSLAQEYLYCDLDIDEPDDEDYYSYSYRDRKYVNSGERLVNLVQKPLLKSCLFLYASLGLIDISYSQPNNPCYELKDKNYLSIYDGLECFRLTELGGYILGQTNSYEVKEDKRDKARIIVDEERLLITFHGKDMLKQTILNQMTHKVGDNHYKMDYESLMSGCSSIGEIEKRIEQFKQQIMDKPPKNWQLFFKKVVKQANPLKKKSSLFVFKLAAQPELYQLIASDQILKKMILKAEDYHIVVDKMKVAAVKKRLLSLGYFIA